MNTEIKTVTPAIAQAWLKKNKNNRSLKKRRIQEYTSDMIDGKWKENGAAIRFDKKGNLLDGQHRLHAIILSKQSIDMVVITGLEPEVFDSIDIGAVRGAGTALEIAKVPNHKRTASALAVVDAYDHGIKGRVRSHIRTNQVLEVLEKYPDMTEAIEEIGSKKVDLLPRSVFDGLYYIFRRRDATMAKEYMMALRDGSNIDVLDCWHNLRERLIRNLSSTTKMDEVLMAALVIKAWNYARNGSDTTKLLWSPLREPFPEAI